MPTTIAPVAQCDHAVSIFAECRECNRLACQQAVCTRCGEIGHAPWCDENEPEEQ
jgi:hypothetical protein